MVRDPLTMAIEASLRDLERDGSKQGENSFEEDLIEMEGAGGTSDEQIESAGKYRSDKEGRRRGKVKEEDEVAEVEEKKDTPRTVKDKKERRRKTEMASTKGCDSPSLEGLTEMDIKRKLIESAKIKSKVARQSSSDVGDKIRRKSKKQENNTSSSASEEKEQKRKSSSDLNEDPSLSSKKRRSSASQERMSDVKWKVPPKCDIGEMKGFEGGILTNKEANFERSTRRELSGKTESTKSGE